MRGKNESFLDNKERMEQKERCKKGRDDGYENAIDEMRQFAKNSRLQVTKDLIELCLLDLNEAIQWFMSYVSEFI